MTRKVTIRPAGDGDAPAIAAIYRHYAANTRITFEESAPADPGILEAIGRATDNGLPFLVAVEHERVIGYAYCTPYRPRAAYRFTAEVSIYLAPDATGRGIGARLLAALIEACERTEIRQLVAVIADTGEEASVKVARRCGFDHVGRLRAVGFKHGEWVDTVIMQRSTGDDGGSR